MKFVINSIFIAIISVLWFGVFLFADNWYSSLQETKKYQEQILYFDSKSLTEINNEKLKKRESEHIEDVEPKEGKEVVFESNIIPEDSTIPLPPMVQLAVPFTSQAPEKNWDQPWQDACEEAAILMMDAYYKKYGISPLFARDEIIKMVEWEDSKNWDYSIPLKKIEELFHWYDGTAKLNTKIIEDPTVGQLKRLLAEGNPILVVADGKRLPNPHFTNGGPEYHALVLTGYTETHFVSNDPGTQHGEGFEYLYDDLIDSIADWDGHNSDSNRKVVLIVE